MFHNNRATDGALGMSVVFHIYGNMGNHMKTTIDLPDELLIEAKKMAAENRLTLRGIFARALRRETFMSRSKSRGKRARPIHWVMVPGGLPADLDVADRENMYAWLGKHDRD